MLVKRGIYLYGIELDDRWIYIGTTIRFEQREREHRRAFPGLFARGAEMVLIEVCGRKRAYVQERRLIRRFKRLGQCHLNHHPAGILKRYVGG